MKTRYVVTAVIAVAAVAVAAASVSLAAGNGPDGAACMPGHGMHGVHGMGMGGGLGLPLHRLDLTDEQRAAIRAVVEAEQPALQELQEKIRASRLSFMEAHPPTEFDEAVIRAHAAEQAPLLADLAVAEARARSKALALLTPEQLTKLNELRLSMHERMMERRELRRGL
jgi:Spy/CpxP family protein refolding chaperone